jgi:fucose permease
MSYMPFRRLLIVACTNFFTIGVISGSLGQLVPDFARLSHSSEAALGALFTVFFLGIFLAQLAVGPLSDHVGPRGLILGGLILLVIGCGGLVVGHTLWLIMTFGTVTGVGHGIVDVGISVLVSESAGKRNVSALNLINVFFGAGAVAGPALVSQMLRFWHTALPILWLTLALLLFSLFMISTMPPVPRSEKRTESDRAVASVYRSSILWMLGIVFLIYVGIETGIGGWTAIYVHRTTSWSLENGALLASIFWLSLTGGRIMATLYAYRVTPRQLLLISLFGSLAGTVLLAVSTGQPTVTAIAVILSGFCFGPIFPTAIAITTAAFPQGASKAASAVIALGSTGGMIIPWIQGIVLLNVSARLSVTFIAVLTLVMAVTGRRAQSYHPQSQ